MAALPEGCREPAGKSDAGDGSQALKSSGQGSVSWGGGLGGWGGAGGSSE